MFLLSHLVDLVLSINVLLLATVFATPYRVSKQLLLEPKTLGTSKCSGSWKTGLSRHRASSVRRSSLSRGSNICGQVLRRPKIGLWSLPHDPAQDSRSGLCFRIPS